MSTPSKGIRPAIFELADLLDLEIDILLSERVARVHPFPLYPPLPTKKDISPRQKRDWILKFIKITKETNHLHLLRFQHEIQVLKFFARPSIPQILFSGIVEESFYYLIYREIEYPSVYQLNQDLETHWTLSTIKTFAEILYKSLRDLHKDGLVHLDIKPANLLYDIPSSSLKIIDFGSSMSRFLPGACFPKYQFVGTPSYAPPEYLLLKSVEPSCDLYACGLTIRELLTGKRCLTFKNIEAGRCFYETYNLSPLRVIDLRPSILNNLTKIEIEHEILPLIRWINQLTSRIKNDRLECKPFWSDPPTTPTSTDTDK